MKFYLIIFFFIANISILQAKEVTFAFDDWCPYLCRAEGEKRGILIDIVHEIFSQSGIETKFTRAPFARAIVGTRKNEYQAIIGVIPEIASGLIFSKEPVIDTQFCFFTTQDSTWKFNGLNTTYPKHQVGIVRNKIYSDNFENIFPARVILSGEESTSLHLIEMVNLKRLDSFIEEKRNIQYTIQTNKLPPLRNAGCLQPKHEYVAFSPQDPKAKDYEAIFSQGLRALKKSGRYEQIIDNYLK